MKVLHFYRTYFPDTQGGLEEVIRQICLNTISLGVESRVLTVSNNPSVTAIKNEEAEIYQVQKQFEIASCTVGLGALKKYAELAKWADVIHLHYPWPFSDMVRLIKPNTKPSVLTYHSDIVRQSILKKLYRPLERRYLSSIDAIVTTSPQYIKQSTSLESYTHKTQTIPLGINRSSYPVLSDNQLSKARNQYGSDFLLFVGVLRYYKGLTFLLDAMANSNSKLLIAGDGPEAKKLKRQAGRLKLKNVEFLGYVSDQDKVALYQLCLAVVLPSHLRSEAFGVTLLEAAMFARPMISTEIGTGTSFVNIHLETGLVVKAGCKDSLKKAIKEIADDKDKSEAMGVCAKERFEKLFTGQLMGKSYYDLYCRILSEKNAD